MAESLIVCNDVYRDFSDTNGAEVLRGINVEFNYGESVSIEGASGCGKSTFLNLLAGLDYPTKGTVMFSGQDLTKMTKTQVLSLRNRKIGIIYQYHHLLPEFSAAENVAMPLLIRGISKRDAIIRARCLLDQVGLLNVRDQKPCEMSGGECQRVAIARALITSPDCVLADEPTGNLDSTNAKIVCDLMTTLVKENNSSLITVTHDASIASLMDKNFSLINGRLEKKVSSYLA